jgi:hypothetical protein
MGHLPMNRGFKSMFKIPHQFNRIGAHFPHGFQGDWEDPKNVVRSSNGTPLPLFSDRENHPIRFTEQGKISHEVAQMNHYIIRARESYDLKRGTPSAASFKDRYTDDFFERYNRNGMRDGTAARFKDRFAELHAEALALPDVLRLHHVCCAEYVVALNRNAGTDPEDDPRYQHHLKAAARVATNRNQSE